MKKIGLIIVALCMCLCAVAQNEYSRDFMRFYVPNSDGSPFPTSVVGAITILENGKTYIKIHANNPYNAAEFSNFQKYAILKDSNIYLKLDNGEIITLVCSLDKTVKDGFVTTQNGVYQNYVDYSYFLIDTTVIDKFKSHDIIKIRGQFKYEIMDGSMQFTPESAINKTKDAFIEAEQETKEKYNASISNNKKQEILKDNPLYGF